MGVTWLWVCPLCYYFPPSLPVTSQRVGKAFSGSPPLPSSASLHPAITLPRYFHSCWFSCIPFKLFGREKKGKEGLLSNCLLPFPVWIQACSHNSARMQWPVFLHPLQCSRRDTKGLAEQHANHPSQSPSHPPWDPWLTRAAILSLLALSASVSLCVSHTHSGQGSGLHTCIPCPSLASRGSTIWRLSIQALERDYLGSEPTSLSQ